MNQKTDLEAQPTGEPIIYVLSEAPQGQPVQAEHIQIQ